MGKRYYCDYCDKTMVATPSIIKTHNNGVVHQKLVNEHYQQYKDPSKIIEEESKKKPCLRFFNGECKFGGLCHFSHYSEEEMNQLKQYVQLTENKSKALDTPSLEELYKKLEMEKLECSKSADSTTLYDSNGVTYVFPWVYNKEFEDIQESLPPSLKRFKIEDLYEASFSEWG